MIRNLRTTVALLFTGAVLVGGNAPGAAGTPASSAPGEVVTSVAQQARTFDGFRFNFDNGESLRPGTRVRDTTRHGNRARVVVSAGGRLSRVSGFRGTRAAGFPAACRTCGRALLQIGDRRSLDPRRATFGFGATVRVSPRRAPRGSDPNIVQKGLIGSPGGQLKLELNGSRPRCVVIGSAGHVRTARGPSVADRRWHRLVCIRRGRVLDLRVDGMLVARGRGATGRVANAAPVKIGGKAVGRGVGNDQYHGRLDNVFMTIRR